MQSASTRTENPVEDRTARARIRDAAIARFAENGVDGTSLRVIAEEAGVSQALVIHHFGTKDGLRAACDEHVVASIREQKLHAMGQGPSLDPLAALRSAGDEPPIMRYLARTIVDPSPRVVALVDGMVDAGVAAVEEGIRSGLLEPTDEPRDLAAVLTLWSLGILALHEHAERVLGVDLTGTAEGRGVYVRAAMRALRGIFTPEAHTRFERALTGADHGGERDDG